MEISSILRSARTGAGLSQEQAAEALGVSRQTVSNWETGKTYPDIVSVIRMSDLYSVSLDRLLKEETSVKQTYKEYLEESTNTVKSNERRSRLILVFSTLGIWALCVVAFFLTKDSAASGGLGTVIYGAILPVLFFTASYILGAREWFGSFRWLAPLVFGLMYAASGTVTAVAGDGVLYRSVRWPDFSKLPVGVMVSVAGLLIALLLKKKWLFGKRGEDD